jgi:hypothetical protein
MKMFRKVVAYLRFFVSRLLRQSKTVCKACELCLFSGNRTICLLVTEDRYLIVLYVAHQVRRGGRWVLHTFFEITDRLCLRPFAHLAAGGLKPVQPRKAHCLL